MPVFQKCLSSSRRQRDSLYSCLVCISASVSYTIILGSQYCFGVLYVAFLEEFGESLSKTAWIGSISFCLATILGPVTSLINKKLSCRTMGIIGHIIMMSGYLLSSFVTEMNYLFFTYGLLTGVGVSLPLLADNVIVAKYFKKYRSLANSTLGVGASIGYLSMNQVVHYILSVSDLKTCFQMLCLFNILPCLLTLTFDPNVEAEEKEEEIVRKEEKQESYFGVLKNYPVVVVLVSWFLFEIGHLIPYVHMVKHCKYIGISKDKGAQLYIYFGATSILGRIMAGVLADTFHISKALIVQWGGFYPMGAAILFLPIIKTYEGLIVYMLLYGFTEGLCVGTYNCLLYDLAGPKQHTQAVGLIFFAMSIPLAVSPPFTGFLADVTGSYDVAFYLVGSFVFLSGLNLNLIRCFKRTSTKELVEINRVSEEVILVVERETVL